MKLLTKFRQWREKLYIRRMIKEAKRMSIAENGKQYHVVMIKDTKKLEVISNELLKHAPKKIKINGISRRYVSVYSTPADCFHVKIEKIKSLV